MNPLQKLILFLLFFAVSALVAPPTAATVTTASARALRAAPRFSNSNRTAFTTASARVLRAAERSFFVRIDSGAGFDLDSEVRSPLNAASEHLEAYSLHAFIVGIFGGFRITEYWGLEGGFSEQRHLAHPEWGGSARYTVGTASLRFAVPTASRQTPFIKLGAEVGAFAYGASSLGNNRSFVAGPSLCVGLEHEWRLGITGVLQVGYNGLHRAGMDAVLVLEEIHYSLDGSTQSTILGTKDFSTDAFIHQLWVTGSIQFEWTIN